MNIRLIYHLLLKLYPRRFYANYAEEMEAVFASALQTARLNGFSAWLTALCREFIVFSADLFRQYAYERSRYRRFLMTPSPKPRRFYIARTMTRLVGLLAALFYLDVLVRYVPNNPQVIPLVAAFILTTLSVLLVWRWERLAGVTTMACALLVALTGAYATYTYEASMGEVITWGVVLATLLWGLPYLIVGALFVKFAQATEAVRS